MAGSFDDNLGYKMSRATSVLLARLNRQLQPLGLRYVDATILVLIDDCPGASQSELCRTLDIASANMVPIVGRLTQRKLVARTKADGRSYGLTLTPDGVRTVSAARAQMDVHEQWVAGFMGTEDVDVLAQFLTRIMSSAAKRGREPDDA